MSNVDPSGQYRAAGFGSTQRESAQATKQHMAQVARMVSRTCDAMCKRIVHSSWLVVVHGQQQTIAGDFGHEASTFNHWAINLGLAALGLSILAAALILFPATAPLGWVVASIGTALGTLAYAAASVSAMLGDMSTESTGSADSVGWFTKANLIKCENNCWFQATGLALGVGLTGNLTYLIAGLIKGFVWTVDSSVTLATGAAAALAGGLVAGAILYGAIVAAGLGWFAGELSTFTEQEEGKVWA